MLDFLTSSSFYVGDKHYVITLEKNTLTKVVQEWGVDAVLYTADASMVVRDSRGFEKGWAYIGDDGWVFVSVYGDREVRTHDMSTFRAIAVFVKWLLRKEAAHPKSEPNIKKGPTHEMVSGNTGQGLSQGLG